MPVINLRSAEFERDPRAVLACALACALAEGPVAKTRRDHRALRRLLATGRERWEAAVTPEACAAPGFVLRNVARGLAEPRAAASRSV
jgi:hypothetical protein